jgi:hypothetical protein
MATSPFQANEQTDTKSVEQILAMGEGSVFKGAPNVDVPAGPEYSPQLKAALNP